jgi:hypothetical protein
MENQDTLVETKNKIEEVRVYVDSTAVFTGLAMLAGAALFGWCIAKITQ